jgi:ribokinase
MPVIAVIGSIVMDIIVETPRIPGSGENLHARQVTPATGGKAANAAVAFTRLGGRAHLLSNVGVDAFGDEALATLKAEGVAVAGVGRVHDAPTGAGVLLVEPDGQTAFIIAPGANLTLTPGEVEERLKPILSKIDGLLFNFEAPEDALLRAVELARDAAIPIFVDAGPARPYSSELWRHAAILSPNEPETEALVGFKIVSDEAARAAASALLTQGPRAVVLKLGARGALLATPDTMRFFPAFPIRPVDAAGAGDAFTAGLVWARLQGWSRERSLGWANACGGWAAARLGAMPAAPDRAQVEAFLEKIASGRQSD